MEWNKLYSSWCLEAEFLDFKPVGYDHLNIYTARGRFGVHAASFYDQSEERILDDKKGWNTTAHRILLNSKDDEMLVAVYISATFHNIFEGKNHTPYQFQEREVLDYVQEALIACKDKLGYFPSYSHLCSDVYPVTVGYRHFNCYHLQKNGMGRMSTYFNPRTLLRMTILDAMLNSKYAIIYHLDKGCLESEFKRKYNN